MIRNLIYKFNVLNFKYSFNTRFVILGNLETGRFSLYVVRYPEDMVFNRLRKFVERAREQNPKFTKPLYFVTTKKKYFTGAVFIVDNRFYLCLSEDILETASDNWLQHIVTHELRHCRDTHMIPHDFEYKKIRMFRQDIMDAYNNKEFRQECIDKKIYPLNELMLKVDVSVMKENKLKEK